MTQALYTKNKKKSKTKKISKITHLRRFLTNVIKLVTFSLINDAKFSTFVRKLHFATFIV